jgi:hypothetical protein
LEDEFALDKSKLDRIKTVEGAKVVLNHFRMKTVKADDKPKEEEEETERKNLASNLGLPEFAPPNDLKNIIQQSDISSEDRFFDAVKPARMNNALKSNCRWNNRSRFLMVFTDEYPEGRFI